MARYSDPFQEELNGLPLLDPPPLGLNATDGRDTVVATAAVPIFATADLTDERDTGGNFSDVFEYTGAYEEYVVPTGVHSLRVRAIGAAGGYYSFNPAPGLSGRGAFIDAVIAVEPGETLRIYVGGDGERSSTSSYKTGGFNGGGQGYNGTGGGGGATDIRRSPYGLEDRLVVAGGGGSGSDANYESGGVKGGDGGYPNGQGPIDRSINDWDGDPDIPERYWSAMGGGATQTAGGNVSLSLTNATWIEGSFGQGANQTVAVGGGGGGGGWYGGGGAALYTNADFSSAGGGSSYVGEGARHVAHGVVDRGTGEDHAEGWGPGGALLLGPSFDELTNRADVSDGRDTAAGSGTVVGNIVRQVPPASANQAFATSASSVNLTAPTMSEGDVLVVAVNDQSASGVTAPGGFGFQTLANAATLASSSFGLYVFAAEEDGIGTLSGQTLTFSRVSGTGDIEAIWFHMRATNGGRIDWTQPVIDEMRPTGSGTQTHATYIDEFTPTDTSSFGSITALFTYCDTYLGEHMWPINGWTEYLETGTSSEAWASWNRRVSCLYLSRPEGAVPPATERYHSISDFNGSHDTVAFALSFHPFPEVDVTDGRDTAVGVGVMDVPAVGTLAATDGKDTGAGGEGQSATLAVSDGIDTAAGAGASYVGPEVASFTFNNPGTFTDGPLVLTKPGGVQRNDLLVMLVAAEYTATSDFNPVDGWTLEISEGDSGSDVYVGVYWRVATGDEAATETISGPDAGGGWYKTGWYLRITGADPFDPINASLSSTGASGTSFTATNVTTTLDQTLAFAFASFDGSDGAPHGQSESGWPTSFPTDQEQALSLVSNQANGVWGGWLTREMAEAGYSGDVTWTASLADTWAHASFAVNAAPTYSNQEDGRDTVAATTGTIPTPLGAANVTDGTDTGGFTADRIYLIDDPTDSLQWQTGNSGGNASMTAPDNLQFGDVLVVAVAVEAGTVTAPAGWTKVIDEQTATDNNTVEIWYIPETVGLDVNDTPYTWTNNGSEGIWIAWQIIRPSPGRRIALPPTITATATGSGTSSHTAPALSGGDEGSFAFAAGTIDGTISGTPNNNWDAPWIQLEPTASYFGKYFTFAYQELDAWDGEVAAGAWNDNTGSYATVAAMFELMPVYQAAASLTDGIDTAAGTGFIPVTGAVAATDGIDTAAGSGDVPFLGAGSAADGTDTLAATGFTPLVASLDETDGIDTLASTASVVYPSEGTAAVTDGIDTAVAVGEVPIFGLFRAVATLFPDRIGVTVGTAATSTHTVIAGTSSRTAGAAAILTGNYAYRGLYSFDTTATSPGDFVNDGRGWVTLASWGDFQFRLRRRAGTIYDIRADFTTAALDIASVVGQIEIPNGRTTYGLGVTRNPTTGAIQMSISRDDWITWTNILVSSSTIFTGVMADAVPEDVVLLGGDLRDGAWISIYKAQWGDTTDINDVDANEVTAWNYGSNIVTGVGGDFYDAFTDTVKESYDFGSNSSNTYSQRVETTDAGTTVRVDFTFYADTLNTATATLGTSTAFTYDPSPLWGAGPVANVIAPAISFTANSQFTVNATGITGSVVARANDGTPDRWRAIIVEKDGSTVTALENAQVGAMTWSLNEIESFSFTMPTLDPDAQQISVADTEVQIWRGDRLVIWGVVVRSLAQGATIEYQCRGLAWYFTKRFIGGPRNNFLENPSFETSTSWWYPMFQPTELQSLRDPANWEAGIVSTRSITGYPGRSMRLQSNNVIEFGVTAFQFIWHEIDAAEWPDGINWTASAWAYIPSADWGYYDDEAEKEIGERNAAYNWGGESAPFGLHLVRMSTTSNQDQDIVPESYPEVYEVAVAGLTDDLPRDEWFRLETSLVQPAPEGGGKRTDWIQVELHAPQGVVFWDEVSLTRNERLFFNETAQEAILFGLVQHAQDTTLGKSDLNIGFAAAPVTNITRTRSYEWFNRELISDAIEEFSTLWNGCDWSIEITPTQRLFSPWFPMKGTRRPGQALRLGKNIARVSVAYDGETMANRVVVRSDNGGSGSSREEAIGTDTTGFADGLVLEASFNAVKESPLDSLDGQVQRALRAKRDGTIPVLTTYEGVGSALFGRITTGDVVTVDAVYGGLVIEGWWRIVAITYNPDDETMDIVVNPFNDYTDPTYQQAVRIGQ